jgi:hypothetical protein
MNQQAKEASFQLLDRLEKDELMMVVVFLVRHLAKIHGIRSFDLVGLIVKHIAIYESNINRRRPH